MKFKTRTERYTEPVTIDGKTHNIERTREFRVPDVPRDWDATLDKAIGFGVVLVVVGALAWSVVSIGSLLSALAPVWLAFLIAGVFDLAWVLAMGMERQLRFEPAKQRVPKIVGWVLLAVSISVIFLHGIRVADLWVALAGSVIAALAKTLWTMRMWSTTRKLSAKAQGWLVAELDEVEATLAVTIAQRKIARTRSRADAELRALGAEQPAEHERAAREQPARPVLVQPSTSVLTGHEQRAGTPSMAELAREQLVGGASRDDVVASILRALPDAKPESVKAEVRRQTRKLDEGTGQYL